ncbi:hypothetical protein HZB05_00275 [Candidatus Wolfebacteria bacterium]|nr:hypothetical protein [Candidatus Wolfebacteria bacterium]
MDYKKLIIKPVIISFVFISILLTGNVVLSWDIKARTADFVRKQTEINDKLSAIESLAYFQSAQEQANKYLFQMDDYLITKDQLLINFSKDINAMARQNNISFNINFGQESDKTAVEPRKTSISLTAQTAASFKNFIGFLESLEKSLYFIKFDNTDLTQDGGQTGIILNGRVYSF